MDPVIEQFEGDFGEEDDMDGIGADRPERDSRRYDPAILYWRMSANDWRTDATTNADGMNRPAVQQGQITFLDVIPNVIGLTNFKEGGKAPYEFTAHRIALRMFFPVAPSDMVARTAPAVPQIINPRGIQLGQVIARGVFSLEADTVPVISDLPVDAVGAAGGIVILGGADSATAQNMGTSRRDGFPLPDPIKLRTSGPSLVARIRINAIDILNLGAAAGAGVGAPLPTDYYAIDGIPPLVVPTAAVGLHPCLALEFWGRRGIDIAAGTMSPSQRPVTRSARQRPQTMARRTVRR